MTSALLAFGCALLAFSPPFSLVFFITYHKALLFIVVTSSAFAFLLSSTLSSLFYVVVPPSSAVRGNPLLLILPSVFSQFVCRCGFVFVYHRVEGSIAASIKAHEKQVTRAIRERREGRRLRERGGGGGGGGNGSGGGSGNGNNNNNGSGLSDYGTASSPTETAAEAGDGNGGEGTAIANVSAEGNQTSRENNTNNDNAGNTTEGESSRLRLDLNDWSAGLAAGAGFAAMHSLMLYGTLLASESPVDTVGTLYQPSCPAVPSLVVSAVNAWSFGILDVLWMMLTFYGMRRRRMSKRAAAAAAVAAASTVAMTTMTTGAAAGGDVDAENSRLENIDIDDDGDTSGDAAATVAAATGTTTARRRNRNQNAVTMMTTTTSSRPHDEGKRREQLRRGNMILLASVMSHTAAGMATSFNGLDDGCAISLPIVSVILLSTALGFKYVVMDDYLPENQRQRPRRTAAGENISGGGDRHGHED